MRQPSSSSNILSRLPSGERVECVWVGGGWCVCVCVCVWEGGGGCVGVMDEGRYRGIREQRNLRERCTRERTARDIIHAYRK